MVSIGLYALLLILGMVILGGIMTFPMMKFPKCGHCSDPTPDGYTADHNGKKLCGKCCEELGVNPWWHREGL